MPKATIYRRPKLEHSKTIQKWCDRHSTVVESYEVDSDGHWIYLKPGYLFCTTECMSIKGNSVADMMSQLRPGCYMTEKEYFNE